MGNITQVTVNDNAFTLLYDDAQFNACLTATVVKDNLQAITETVDEEERLRIVLSKLYEVRGKLLDVTSITDEKKTLFSFFLVIFGSHV